MLVSITCFASETIVKSKLLLSVQIVYDVPLCQARVEALRETLRSHVATYSILRFVFGHRCVFPRASVLLRRVIRMALPSSMFVYFGDYHVFSIYPCLVNKMRIKVESRSFVTYDSSCDCAIQALQGSIIIEAAIRKPKQTTLRLPCRHQD